MRARDSERESVRVRDSERESVRVRDSERECVVCESGGRGREE